MIKKVIYINEKTEAKARAKADLGLMFLKLNTS
jgi:hypothetical protein